MKVSTETVEIARNCQEVFDFLTDFAHIETQFEHVVDVNYVQEKPAAVGDQFQQTRIVHGRRYPEIVTVMALGK